MPFRPIQQKLRNRGGLLSGVPEGYSGVWDLRGLDYLKNAPLLDIFPGADGAYSLRRLSSTYTGPVVRVRRSNDNAEDEFSASEVATGALSSWIGANTGYVVTWFDQTGNGASLTQATAANQPQVNLTEGSVFFPEQAGAAASGSGYWLLSTSLPVTSNDLTYFSVVRLTARNSGRNKYGRILSLTESGFQDFNKASGMLISDTPDNGSDGLMMYSNLSVRAALPTLALNQKAVVGGLVNGSSANLYKNKTSDSGSFAGIALDADEFRIGNNASAFDSAMAGHYYMGVMYRSVLSGDRIDRLTDYLSGQWSV